MSCKFVSLCSSLLWNGILISIGPSFVKLKWNVHQTRKQQNCYWNYSCWTSSRNWIVHIPEKHFQNACHYGVYAKHHKQEKKKLLCKRISAKNNVSCVLFRIGSTSILLSSDATLLLFRMWYFYVGFSLPQKLHYLNNNNLVVMKYG